jgi:hypothetical protein
MLEAKGAKPLRKRSMLRSGTEDLTAQVSELLKLDTLALRQKWRELLGAEPSPQFGRTLLLQVIAYRIQERALGGLKPSVQRFLDRIAEQSPQSAAKTLPKPRPGAGTVLLREWGGVRHRVTMLNKDVVYNGRRYKSLSAVARVITGTHWSGPLFFGLARRSREAANG